MEKIENLCIFMPEFTSKNQTNIEHFRDIMNILRHFDGYHTIEKVHILSFFMGSAIPSSLMDFPNFPNIYFYTLSLSNELNKYACFIEEHKYKPHTDEDDMTLESKLEAFKLKGNLDGIACYRAFYNHHVFQNSQ